MSDLERDRLRDERRLLLASLEDAAAEHAAGELDEASMVELIERDQARLAEVERALADFDVEPEDAASTPVRPTDDTDHLAGGHRRWGLLVVGALAIIVALVVILVARGGTGSTASPAQISALLAQGDTLAQRGKVAEALAVYSRVLALDPLQPEALSQSGFLTFEAGLSTASPQLTGRGEAQVREAAALAPKDFAPRLYLGVIELLGNADPKTALKEFAAFKALHPPAKWVRRAQPYIDKATAAVHPTTTVPG